MLRFFRKPKWQHKSPEIRLDALNALSVSEQVNLEILNNLARHDPETKIRKAALSRLDDLALIMELHQQKQADPDFQDWLQGKLLNAIKQKQLTSNMLTQLFNRLNDNMPAIFVETLAQHAPDPSMRRALLPKISKESLLSDLVLNDESHEVRMQALTKIQQEKALKRLLKEIKNKDKIAARYIKEQLEQFEAIRQLPIVLGKELERCCVELEGACHLKQISDVEKVMQSVQTHYDSIAARAQQASLILPEDTASRFARATEKVRTYSQGLKDAFMQQQRIRSALSQTIEEYQTCLQALNQLKQQNLNALTQGEPIDVSEFETSLETLNRRWSTLPALPEGQNEELRQAWQDAKSECNTLMGDVKLYLKVQQAREAVSLQLQSALNDEALFAKLNKNKFKSWVNDCQMEQDFAWIDNHESQATLQTLITALEQRLTARESQWNQDEKECAKLLSIASSSFSQGQYKKSKGIFHKLEEKLATLPEFKRARLQKRVDTLKQDLSEIKDWQAFVSTPRKDALCAVVEDLAKNPREIEEQARLLQEARDMWKSLGAAEAELEEPLWKRFNQACEAAFQPCKEAYEQQAKMRQDNLQQRQQHCDAFERYLSAIDWSSFTEWDKLEANLRDFKTQWSTFGPTDRKDKNAMQKRFQSLSLSVVEQINAYRRQNTQAKKQLIDKVEQLLNAEDIAQAIEQAKALQTQWKAIGRAAAGEDKALWLAFREQCDALFKKRDESRDENKKQQNQAIAKYNQLVTQLSEILQSVESGDLQAIYQREALLEQWNQSEKIENKKLITPLQQRFDSLYSQIEQAHQHALKRAEIDSLDLLSQYDHQLQLIEQNLFDAYQSSSMADSCALQTQYDDFTALLAQVPSVEKMMQNRLSVFCDWLNHLSAKTPQKIEQLSDLNEQAVAALQNLCFDMEILLEIESPIALAKMRMEYQLKMLSEKMMSGSSSLNLEPYKQGIDLQKQWANLSKWNVSNDLQVRFADLLTLWKNKYK